MQPDETVARVFSWFSLLTSRVANPVVSLSHRERAKGASIVHAHIYAEMEAAEAANAALMRSYSKDKKVTTVTESVYSIRAAVTYLLGLTGGRRNVCRRVSRS